MKFVIMGAILAILSGVSKGSKAAEAEFCVAIIKLLDAPPDKGLLRYQLDSFKSEKGANQFSNLDIDGDDRSDTVNGGCYGSLMSADPCDLSVSLTSGKKINFIFKENEKFYLARYRGRIIAVTSPASVVADEKTGLAKPVPASQIRGHRTIYLLSSSGINPICKQL